MARPLKNNADYFSHDANMRNHRKVKAIRNKFGLIGYSLWSMILEYMTGIDGNVFEYSDLEFELMSGDFGVPATDIKSVVDYCISLEMLFNENGFIKSPSLDERLAPVYTKRGKAKELSKKQLRVSGKFCSNNTEPTVVSVAETPQSKVKEIKVKESIIAPSDFFQSSKEAYDEISKNYKDVEQAKLILSNRGWLGVTDVDVGMLLFHFVESQADITKKPKPEARQHFQNWLNKRPLDELTGLSKTIRDKFQRQAAKVS